MYIPVLRYRLAERGAFKALSKINVFKQDKIIPLVEIVQHYPTGRVPSVQKSFEQVYTEEFQENEFPIIIDIPLYLDLSLRKIEEKYKRFLEANKLDMDVRLNYLLKLSKLPNVIPVVTYDPNTDNEINSLRYQENKLRKSFANSNLCFRIFTDASKEMLRELKNLVQPKDIVLLDLQYDYYLSNRLLKLYEELHDLKIQNKCITGLIHTPFANNFSSSTISNDTIINKLDNSLLENYKRLNFDAFGDFAGTKRDTLIESYRGQITSIFYCREYNKYIGFTARPSMNPKDYALIIAPSISKSKYWSSYDNNHQLTCPGCFEIQNKVDNINHPGNRSTWKAISIEHYVYSIGESI